VQRTAFVQHQGGRLLVVELQDPSPDSAVGALRERLEWAHLDDLRVVARIPVDKRHNAKVDYPALTRLLNRRRGVHSTC
jgi:hypothetical protein